MTTTSTPLDIFDLTNQEPSSKVIADSITEDGWRLITVQETFWRPVLAERNTHCVQAKNSASSRARSVHKVLAELHESLALPLSWPREQKGMQGGEEFSGDDLDEMKTLWVEHAKSALATAERLVDMGLHKSVVNRLLEPYSMHTAVTTATAWDNYLFQRVDADAQPEIRAVALLTEQALRGSVPRVLQDGEWHLPYIQSEDWEAMRDRNYGDLDKLGKSMYPDMVKISVARVARTSYLTQEGKRDVGEDLGLYDRLFTNRIEEGKPVHWSPLEQVATPASWNRQEGAWAVPGLDGETNIFPVEHLPRIGKYTGWISLRHIEEARTGMVTYR